MAKVEKNTLQEMIVNFKEFFVGGSVEEATRKAHEQEMPKEDALITITDRRSLGSKIKLVSKDNDEHKSQTNQGSESKEKQVGGTNEQT